MAIEPGTIVAIRRHRILNEVERALWRRSFAVRVGDADRITYLDLIRREALIVSPRSRVVGVAADPGDDHVLAAALDGAADYLATGDNALLELAIFRDIPIVRARELLEVLAAS